MGGVISLTVFALGAALFPMLSVAYWRELRHREQKAGEWGILAFSLVGAGAYVVNLSRQLGLLESDLSGFVLRVLTSLMAGLVVALAEGPWWGAVLVAAAGLARGIWSALDAGEAGVWVTAAALSIPAAWKLRGSHRWWVWGSCGAMLVGAGMWLWQGGAWWRVMPDYAMLVLFGATLYYRERLLFFDVVMKQGALVAVAMALLLLLARETGNAVLWAAPLVIAAPWVSGWLGRAVDRLWLGRRFSPAEAERLFLETVQVAESEEQLLRMAGECAGRVFRAPARAVAAGQSVRLELGRRVDGVPMLSDDLRLQQSLERTLGVVRENVRFRESQRRQEEQEQMLRLLASRAELKALRAQINPHFLFNALNSIAGLIRDRPDLADETLEQLAHVFRYTLRRSEQEWVTLGEELDFVTAYLSVEQARFGERLHVRLEVDEEARRVQVPAMLVQPLVENAIRHGVAEREEAGHIALRVFRAGDKWEIEVANNGPGFPKEFGLEGGHNGHGLKNVAARLSGYYSGEAGLAWNQRGEETRVRVWLPAAREHMDARADRG